MRNRRHECCSVIASEEWCQVRPCLCPHGPFASWICLLRCDTKAIAQRACLCL